MVKSNKDHKPWFYGSTRQADFRQAVTLAALDLFTRKQHGHLGDIAYLNGGGKLYEKFMRANTNYSLFSGEIGNITANRDAIAQDLAGTERAIIVGPGPKTSFEQKEMKILKLLPNLKEVHIVDLNSEFNRQAIGAVEGYARKNRRNIHVTSHEMDFRNAAAVIQPGLHTSVLCTGSLVSNVPNAPLNGFPDYDMGQFISAFATLAGEGGKVLLGYDSNDSAHNLEKSYNKDLAPFIENVMNILVDHSKNIKGLDTSKGHFCYESEWIKRAGQVAHKLVALKPQQFSIQYDGKNHKLFFEEGDEFVVMPSLRPSVERMTKIGQTVNMETTNTYISQSGIVDQIFTVGKNGVKHIPTVDPIP